jgi:hypothetical protein
MLKKLWAWLFPQELDCTQETTQRLTKACAECGAALYESQRRVDALDAKLRTATKALEIIRDGIPGPALFSVDVLQRLSRRD